MVEKTCVIFPGVGYHADKPLLYYARKLAAREGYTVHIAEYGPLPDGIFGNEERLGEAVELACVRAVESLKDIDLTGEVLAVSKSIGTAVACRLLPGARHVLYTPIQLTLREMPEKAIVFHGTRDPWADTPSVRLGCAEKSIPLEIIEDANHSLETGDVLRDLRILETVMARTECFIREETVK